MKTQYLLLITLFMGPQHVLAQSGKGAQPAPSVDVKAWKEHMQALSGALADGFPFFYSTAEFKSKENRDVILKHLEVLRSKAHSLPTKTGDAIQGHLPLGEAIQESLKKQLSESIDLFNKGQFEGSQERLHQAIQTCFACHTTTVTGQQFPTANEEILGVATSNIFGKAMAFGALRQFNGVLDLIEKEAKKRVKGRPEDSELIRSHLVVSLRVQENFERASSFLNNWSSSAVVKGWLSDIEAWDRLEEGDSSEQREKYWAERKAKAKGAELFVVQLWESSLLHPRAVREKAGPDKARLLAGLAGLYEGIGFKPLATLAPHYKKACVQLAPANEAAKVCATKN